MRARRCLVGTLALVLVLSLALAAPIRAEHAAHLRSHAGMVITALGNGR